MAFSFRKCLNTFKHISRNRGIMTTPRNMEKAIEKLQQNPYYDKYSDRIAALQKTSPEEFMQRVEKQEQKANEEKKKKFAPIDTRQFSSVLNPKAVLNSDVNMEEKKLESIFKVELVKNKEALEIQSIWEEYHKNKEVICATIPLQCYSDIHNRMQTFPTFLFPLPRSQGYEFILCQSYRHTLHFTPLLAFQVHKENAPECLTVVHYTELSDKGLVLMRGEYDKNVLTGKEAQCLANQFQLFYNGKDETKLNMLEAFTKSPDSFKHIDLIAQFENIGL